ncbi:MAG: hypothetical protein ACREF8_07420 [Chthoniobacterales bacterium]
MNKRVWFASIGIAVLLCGIVFCVHRYWIDDEGARREKMLSTMPSAANVVFFADTSQLRQTPFIAQLFAWAPKPQVDAEYAKFLRDTGFDYERDLDRIAIGITKRGQDTTFFAVAEGRFDRRKINTYTSQFGTHESRGGREIFSVPVKDSKRKISFTFPSLHGIALTDDPDVAVLIAAPPTGDDAKEWRVRFNRLAGSPLFAVIRQDAATDSALETRALGGLQSQQFSAMLDQLQWITIAGKPEEDRLRVVMEGECPTDAAARQFSDLLNGVLTLAQAGLNGPQVRQQLDPQAREAYLEMLKAADIARLDRGETKSVRLIFDVTPKFLAAARTAAPEIRPQQRPNHKPNRTPPHE